MSVIIRAMTIADYPAAHALWSACEGIGLSDADARPAVEGFLARNPGLSFVAVEGEELVGTALCGHDGRRGYLYHLAVRPDRRREGLGRRLADHCLDGLRAAGIGKCHLFVFRSNRAAAAFWERIGWAERQDLMILSRPLP